MRRQWIIRELRVNRVLLRLVDQSNVIRVSCELSVAFVVAQRASCRRLVVELALESERSAELVIRNRLGENCECAVRLVSQRALADVVVKLFQDRLEDSDVVLVNARVLDSLCVLDPPLHLVAIVILRSQIDSHLVVFLDKALLLSRQIQRVGNLGEGDNLSLRVQRNVVLDAFSQNCEHTVADGGRHFEFRHKFDCGICLGDRVRLCADNWNCEGWVDARIGYFDCHKELLFKGGIRASTRAHFIRELVGTRCNNPI